MYVVCMYMFDVLVIYCGGVGIVVKRSIDAKWEEKNLLQSEILISIKSIYIKKIFFLMATIMVYVLLKILAQN